MKVLTLKADENIAMYKNHKTMILQVKALQVHENIMNKKHENTIL